MNINRFRIRGLCGVLVAVLCLGLAHPAGAWSEPEWVRQFGTPGGDSAKAVATDREGNVYVTSEQGDGRWISKYSGAGAFLWNRKLPADLWATSAVATDAKGDAYVSGTTSATAAQEDLSDAVVIKYSAAGAPLWRRQFATPKLDGGAGIATDREGNVYLAGDTMDLACACAPPTHAWLAKYSSAGALSWSRQFSSTDYADQATGVATGRDGNVYTIGQVRGPRYSNILDAWLAKYSGAGSLLWLQKVAPIGADTASGVAIYNHGYVFVALGLWNEARHEARVAKFSPAGEPMWSRQIQAPGDLNYTTGLAADRKGSVYVAGYDVPAGPSQPSHGAWLVKYSSAGAPVWRRRLGGSGDTAEGVATDDDDSVYLAGGTFGALGGPNQGSRDAFVAKYSQRR